MMFEDMLNDLKKGQAKIMEMLTKMESEKEKKDKIFDVTEMKNKFFVSR